MINNLLNLIEESKSVYHAEKALSVYLEKNKFKKLDIEKPFNLKKGGKFYIAKDGAVLAFRIDTTDLFKIVVSHTDSPTLKIKSNPDIDANGYHLLNMEVYGGPILNTWFDKPLSIAGVVQYLEKDKMVEKLVDFNRPICTIANLAIHMNREVNNGVKIDKQKDLKPVLQVYGEEADKEKFADILAKELGIDKESILSYELNLYNVHPPILFGLENEFVQSARLDNLSMAISSIEGLVKSKKGVGISMAACLNNEEIGSQTLSGGDSNFLGNMLERIAINLGMNREDYLIALEKSFAISADLAHAVHPNFSDKADLTNRPVINKGFVIKNSSNKRYATDSKSEGYLVKLAKKNKIDYQTFFNNSNEVGGSSLGPIVSAKLPMRTIDIGNPILAMHSERETGGVKDYEGIIKLFTAFYGDK
ncbi:MAG: M18 family aminopeptidase [Peptostreptococcaceae bacterium]|nr:M18 family aminopeptidase [Peptostreptococcaceae bacterium]